MELSQTDIEFITQENLKIRDILNYLKPKILKAYEDGTGIKIIKEIIKSKTDGAVDISYNTLSKFIYSNIKKNKNVKNSDDAAAIEKILTSLNEINKKIEELEYKDKNIRVNCDAWINYIILFAIVINFILGILNLFKLPYVH